jgi:DNA processing protein
VNSKEAFIALNLIEGVGPIRVRQLLDVFGDAPSILRASRDQLCAVPGVGEDTAAGIANWSRTVDLDAELRRITEFGCHVLVAADEEYPPSLREIYDPPIVLYVKGRLNAQDRNAVAIVGSRQTTPYGMEVARRLGYQLGYVGVTVVSGGARGIDTAAHQGALKDAAFRCWEPELIWSSRRRTGSCSNAWPNMARWSRNFPSIGRPTNSRSPSGIGSWPA